MNTDERRDRQRRRTDASSSENRRLDLVIAAPNAASLCRQSGLNPQKSTGNALIIAAASSRRESGLNPRTGNAFVISAASSCRQSGLNPRRTTGNFIIDAALSRRQFGKERRGQTGHQATKERLNHAVACTRAASVCRHLESHRQRRIIGRA